MLRRLARTGLFWLLLCCLPLVIYHIQRLFDYLKTWSDSGDYLEMFDMDLLDPQGLSTLRPWGYAVFLKLYTFAFDDIGQVVPQGNPWVYLPACHLALHIFSVLVFYAGLRQLSFPSAASVLMCLPILYFDYLNLSLHSLLANAPGQAFLLMTVSSFFFVLRKPTRPLRWLSLALCVFAAYHLRAAFQFLLVMLPFITLLLGSCSGNVRKHRLTMAAVMVVICWLPFLAYCGWRYHVVGQFSLVACTGFQFSGFTGLLLTEEMLPEVPAEYQPLAKAIITGREDPDAQEQNRLWKWVLNWHHEEDEEGDGWVPPLRPGQGCGDLDYTRIQQQYSWVVWQVLWHRWAEEEYVGTVYDKYLAADRHFLAFSLDFFQRHPDLYAMCVLKGWRAALVFAFERWAMRVPLILCGLMAPLLSLRARASDNREETPPGGLSPRRRFGVLTCTVLAFFILKVQLIAMSAAVMRYGDVDGRYPEAAALLLPCLPMLGVYYLWQYTFRALRSPA